MTMDEIGEKIKKKRRALQVDQQTVSEYTGLSVNTISFIENGRGNPTVQSLLKVLNFLGLDIIVQ